MKEYSETLIDYFTDFAGRTHYFVISAISKLLPTEIMYDGETYLADHWVIQSSEYNSIDIDPVVKCVSIGIAICNPNDEFNEYIGEKKALARARNNHPILYSTKKGYINSTLVKALLLSEANHIRQNPGCYIPGYDDAAAKYKINQQMQQYEKEMTEFDKEVIDKINSDPEYLNHIVKYKEWMLKKL